jgi:hypothetical protein
MPANGQPANGEDLLPDLKTPPPSSGDGRTIHTTVADAKPATIADAKSAAGKRSSRRRNRDRQETPAAGAEERFFLASGDGDDGVPALGRDCPNEADAIIEAFRAKLTFYRICEFQTRAEIGPSEEPILRKEALKRRNPAS